MVLRHREPSLQPLHTTPGCSGLSVVCMWGWGGRCGRRHQPLFCIRVTSTGNLSSPWWTESQRPGLWYSNSLKKDKKICRCGSEGSGVTYFLISD